jgi:hypothetical protein
MSPTANISILQCDRQTISKKTGRPFVATKTWQIGSGGKPEPIGFDAGTFFRCQPHPVSNIYELSGLLEILLRRPHQFLIRGIPAPNIDLAKPVRRMKHPDQDRDGMIWFTEEAGQPWVLIDIDNFPVPAEIDPVRDPQAAISYLVEHCLPPELRDVTFVWQWSSSTGMKGAGFLSAHLWFWLDRPMTEAELKGWFFTDPWLRENETHIDPTLFRLVQPHYTAAPVFEGITDPLACRIGIRKGAKDVASLQIREDVEGTKPRKSNARHRSSSSMGLDYDVLSNTHGFEAKLALMGDGIRGDGVRLQGFHRVVTSAAASYVRAHGKVFDRHTLKGSVIVAIMCAPKRAGRDADIARYLSDEYLDHAIDSATRRYGEEADMESSINDADIFGDATGADAKREADDKVGPTDADDAETAHNASAGEAGHSDGPEAEGSGGNEAAQCSADEEVSGAHDEKTKKIAQRDRLLALGLRAELWHDPNGTPFASVSQHGHVEHHPIGSQSFTNWLINAFMEQHDPPAAPSSTAVKEAQAGLTARAAKGPMKETFVRVGAWEGNIYLDLGNDKFDAIEINDFGWRIVSSAPVPLVRYAGMEALPYPVRGGQIAELKEYLNLPDDDAFKLVVAYCVNLLFPRGPYPLLEFAGPMGSLKTAATRAIKRLVDPNKVDLRSKPRNEDDLLISAEHNHVLTFENLSSISAELSDQLCRLATGAGLSKRALYTNKDETLLDACRPVILNGIPDLIDRGDLADRAIMLVLPTFKGTRRADEEVKLEFDTVVRPRMLGCLLEAATRALALQDIISLPQDAPRMADFARLAMAAFPKFGWPEEDFMRVWRSYRRNAAEKSVEADAVGSAVRRFMLEKAFWQGESRELLDQLEHDFDTHIDKTWPKTDNHLTNRLRRAMPMLSAIGIEIDLDRKDPVTRRRLIGISKVAGAKMAA